VTSPEPPPDAGASQDALHHLLRQRVIKAFANGTTSEYVHQITRVLREEGAQRFASWRLPHWSGAQRARILSCTVRHGDGSVEHPRLDGSWVAIRSLQPGDIVEVAGRIDDLAPSFFGTYFGREHEFTGPDGAPGARSLRTVVTTPGRDYRWQACGGAPEPMIAPLAGGEQRYDWEMDGLGRDEPEIARPARKERNPLVRLTTYRDWDHFATWWWNLIQKQIDVTPPMRAKVKELCADALTPAARLDAIYRFVTTDVRYEAWEFGVHGYKPYNPSVIFERRHGDCKDKALLLCALLREVGIVARPVLIFASDRRTKDDLSVPLVNHFNHCIAWLPEQDGIGSRFIDGTAKLHPSDLVPGDGDDPLSVEHPLGPKYDRNAPASLDGQGEFALPIGPGRSVLGVVQNPHLHPLERLAVNGLRPATDQRKPPRIVLPDRRILGHLVPVEGRKGALGRRDHRPAHTNGHLLATRPQLACNGENIGRGVIGADHH